MNVPDLSREGPFDIHQGHQHSGASPRLRQDNQGCPFRLTSYDTEEGGPDLSPVYGVQLHDPRLLEYVGAPESGRLLSRSPEYWVQHMGREKTLSVALQLQHDAGLILSNVQVLQQLVTALNGASSGVIVGCPWPPAVSDRRDATRDVILPSPPGGPLHDSNGFMAPTSRAGNTRTSAGGDVQCLHVLQ